uniref:Uncharacterized protein n=1 Tax=Caenorhabditis tropicalis TaxID=1561998 RepID=A0A1I7UYI1_9PELO
MLLNRTSPDVHLRATFHIMQGWWGEINLGFEPLKSTLVFNRYLEEIGTRLEIIINVKDHDETIVNMKIPCHHFTEVKHTDRKSASDLPTALIFHFSDEGIETFKQMLPGRVSEWESRQTEKKQVLSRSLLFVLDPSDFIMAEAGLLLYRPGFIEGIELFKLNYNEQWENHLCEQQSQYGKEFSDAIVPIDGKDFIAYFKKFGLRNVESEHLAGYKKRPIRIFLGRRIINRKPKRGTKRRSRPVKAVMNHVEEEDEEGDDGEEDEDDDNQPGPSTKKGKGNVSDDSDE